MVELQYCLRFARFDYSKDTESVLSPPFHESSKNLSLKVAPGSPSSVLLLPFSSGLLNHHITHWPPSTSIMVTDHWLGTTGRPKAVELSHANYVANILQMEPLDLGMESKAQVQVMPMFHAGGFKAMMETLYHGGTCVSLPSFTPGN